MGVFEGMSNVFTIYGVELTFRDKLMGGIPKDPKIIEGWLKSQAGITNQRELAIVAARTMEENGADLGEVSPTDLMEMDPDEIYELMDVASEQFAGMKQTNGFKQDENGLYIEDRQVKAMLKETTNIVFPYQKGKPEGQWGVTKKAPRSFVAVSVFVRPQRLYLGRDEPDGIELMVGHIKDRNGKRSTLTYYEYVEKPVIEFELEVVRDQLTTQQWADLWLHAEENGLGALRSQSYGRFDVTNWEKRA